MKVISRSKSMVSLHVYVKNCLYYEILKQGNYYPFSSLTSASSDTISPAVYLKEFVYNGRMKK